MQSMLSKRKHAKPLKTSEVIQAWDAQAARYCATTEAQARQVTVAQARGLLDRFVSSRTQGTQQGGTIGLPEGKRDALARKIASSSTYRQAREQAQAFYQQVAPELTHHLLGHTEQLDHAADCKQRAQAAESAHADVVGAALEEAETLVAAARTKADEIMAEATAVQAACVRAAADQEAEARTRKNALEREMAELSAQLLALQVRKQAFSRKDIDRLVLTACGSSFDVPLHVVEQSDFFFPCHMQAPDATGAFHYEVPNVTAQELRAIAYFFKHDQLPGIAEESVLNRALLRDTVERHGPTSLLEYIDDPDRYVANKYFSERFDRSVSRRASIYLKIPEYLVNPGRTLVMRQLSLDSCEFLRLHRLPVSSSPNNKFGFNIFTMADYCNELSKQEGLKPAYAFNEERSTEYAGLNDVYSLYWSYDADGFRMPTTDEWRFAMDKRVVSADTAQADQSSGPWAPKASFDAPRCNHLGFVAPESSKLELTWMIDHELLMGLVKKSKTGYVWVDPEDIFALCADSNRYLKIRRATIYNGLQSCTFRPVRYLNDSGALEVS